MRARVGTILIGGIGTLVLGFLLSAVHEALRVKKTDANLKALQLAVERYSIDEPSNNSLYPNTIEQAIDAGYLAGMPVNPYTGKPMQAVGIGEKPSAGDYSYIVNREEIAPGYWFATDYVLLAFSKRGSRVPAGQVIKRFPDSAGVRWRYVCRAFQSGIDCKYDPELRRKARQERLLSYLATLAPEERAVIRKMGAK